MGECILARTASAIEGGGFETYLYSDGYRLYNYLPTTSEYASIAAGQTYTPSSRQLVNNFNYSEVHAVIYMPYYTQCMLSINELNTPVEIIYGTLTIKVTLLLDGTALKLQVSYVNNGTGTSNCLSPNSMRVFLAYK